MFDIGFQELVIIFIAGMLVVGPEKLPELGRTAGKWMIEVRKGISAVKVNSGRPMHGPGVVAAFKQERPPQV